MSFLLGLDFSNGKMPSPDDLEQAFAAIQMQFGKQEGLGRWGDLPIGALDLMIRGAGNVVAPGAGFLGLYNWVILGRTMLLNVYINGVALTIPTPTTAVFIKIPGGYRSAVSGTPTARHNLGPASVVNAGIVDSGWLNLDSTTGDYVAFTKRDLAAFVADTGLFCYGNIAIEVIAPAR